MAAKKPAKPKAKAKASKKAPKSTSRKGPGRPIPRDAYKPAYVEMVRNMCRLGMIDIEIADVLGVTERTINRWKHAHPEFEKALRIGKNAANRRVERALYKRAVGFEFDSEKVFLHAKTGQPVRVPTREYVAPDVHAQMNWLHNRVKKRWKDTKHLKVGGDSDNPEPIKVGIVMIPPKAKAGGS